VYFEVGTNISYDELTVSPHTGLIFVFSSENTKICRCCLCICGLTLLSIQLFKACCTPIYGCSLWCSMFQYSLNKLRVAYNDIFRFLLNEPRWRSASRLFVLHSIPSFSAVIHKSICSLWCNLKNSDNVLVQTFLLSDICMLSPLFKSWRTSIFKYIEYVLVCFMFIIFMGFEPAIELNNTKLSKNKHLLSCKTIHAFKRCIPISLLKTVVLADQSSFFNPHMLLICVESTVLCCVYILV